MKRLLSIVLALGMVLSMTTIVTAENNHSLKPTEYEGIFVSEEEEYFLKIISDDIVFYQQVGKMDIDYSNSEEYNSALNDERLSLEIKDELKHQYSFYKETMNQGHFSTIFSPSLLDNPNRLSTTYYTYNGTQMKSERVYSYSVDTGLNTIYLGSSSSSSASVLYNLILIALGLSPNTTVALLAGGVSVLSAFLNEFGSNQITGHYSDYVQVAVTYDDIKQWTYAYFSSEWTLCLGTQKTTLTKIETRQYYFNANTNTGHTTNTTRTTSQVKQSEHFTSPWAYAYQHILSPATEWTEWNVGSKYFYF